MSTADKMPFPAGVGWSAREAEDRKLLWLTFLRVAIVTVLLGSTIVVNFTGGTAALPAYLYALIAVVYLLTLVYVFLLRRRAPHRAHATLQIGADVAVYTVLVYLTGGAESAFTFIYSLAIINAAILLYRRGALWTATACTAVFAALVTLEAFAVVPPFEGNVAVAVPPTPLGAFNTVFTNGAAFFFVALLSSFLAEQLRVTESALAEATGGLQDLRALSEKILRSIGDGLLTASLEGRVTFANASACEILDADADALVGRHLTEVFPELDGAAGWEAALSKRYRELVVRREGKRPRAVLGLSASALRDASGGASGWLLVFHDLTVLKAMEETVRRSERLAAIGRVAADMAHEIRNPLASMTGSIELLSNTRDLPSEAQELMGIVLREGERLDRLISELLEYARPREPDVAPFDLANALDETVAMWKRQWRDGAAPQVVSEIASPLPIEGDPHQIKQVVWNVLRNAGESLEQGGVVTLRARVGNRGGAVIEIEDTGTGIASEDLPHLFEPFFTRKAHGTGLGLAIVHRIIESHGGRVEVTSAPGRGSRFVITLPARPPADALDAAEAT